MDRKKIILDVDTGSDDAVAIMAAVKHPGIQLEAVCSVAGNKPIDNTTENTLRVLQALGSSAPVYRGCGKPIVKHITPTRIADRGGSSIIVNGKEIHIHPEYLNLPESKRPYEDKPAPVFYVDYLRAAKEPVTIVMVGPLTNLAVALMIDPTIVKNIEKLVIMGGGANYANHTPVAEFNIWADPDAAQWVINCGVPVVMVPLDATEATAFSREDAETFKALGTFEGGFCAEMINIRIDAGEAIHPHDPDTTTAIHDALALAAAVDESLLKDVRHVHCDIGLTDFGEGATFVTHSKRFHNTEAEKNVYFAYNADKQRFFELLLKLFA